jgi:hypothetical protein
MPCDLLPALFDPTAPIPSCWPTGAWGALLVFLLPLAGGVPIGVLMARDGGVPPYGIVFLYLLSDIVLAFTAEPMIWLGRWLGRRYERLGQIGRSVAMLETQVGIGTNGFRGRLSLILFAFCVSPTSGRAAAALAGHGFLSGWTLAIIGDMLYFLVLMVSTLWLSDLLGDSRLVVAIMFVASWLLPVALRRIRKGRASTPSAARPPL